MGEAPPLEDTGPMKELGLLSLKRDVGGLKANTWERRCTVLVAEEGGNRMAWT